MPLRLQVFERRYLIMMDRVLAGPRTFGVVLIERGREVGGREQRFGFGTVAQVLDHRFITSAVGLGAVGGPRFEVVQWLPDRPFPQAEVRLLPPLPWSETLLPLRGRAERAVRRALAIASEFTAGQWPPDVELDPDPALACWQLAGVAPLGPLDHFALLRSTTLAQLLERTAALATAAAETRAFGAPGPGR